MKKILFGVIVSGSFIFGNTVSAKGTYPACPTENLYSSFVSAMVSGGTAMAAKIYVPKGCTLITKGSSLRVVERNWSTAKVMFFDTARQQNAVVYTAIEAVR